MRAVSFNADAQTSMTSIQSSVWD